MVYTTFQYLNGQGSRWIYQLPPAYLVVRALQNSYLLTYFMDGYFKQPDAVQDVATNWSCVEVGTYIPLKVLYGYERRFPKGVQDLSSCTQV